MKKKISKIVLATLVITSLLASMSSFKFPEPNGDKEKNWEIELILQGGNTDDFTVEVTAVDDGKKISNVYDLGKDMVPMGKKAIEVKEKDALEKVLVTRDDAVSYIVKVQITETIASTGKKVREKIFTMPNYEKEFLIVWNE